MNSLHNEDKKKYLKQVYFHFAILKAMQFEMNDIDTNSFLWSLDSDESSSIDTPLNDISYASSINLLLDQVDSLSPADRSRFFQHLQQKYGNEMTVPQDQNLKQEETQQSQGMISVMPIGPPNQQSVHADSQPPIKTIQKRRRSSPKITSPKPQIDECSVVSPALSRSNLNVPSCFSKHFATYRDQKYGIHCTGKNIQVELPQEFASQVSSCCLALFVDGCITPVANATIKRKYFHSFLSVKMVPTKSELMKLIEKQHINIDLDNYLPDQHPNEVKGCFGPWVIVVESTAGQYATSNLFFLSTHVPKTENRESPR